MADNSKDSKILAYKDMINQLNKTISAQTELIQSLQKTLEADRLEKENLRQQIVHFALSGGRKCVLERPLCGA